MNKRIYLFDLFDTVLHDVALDFTAGLKLMWERHFREACTLEELTSCGDEFLAAMREVQGENREFRFDEDEIPMYCKKFGIEPFAMDDDEEFAFADAACEVELKPVTKQTLDELQARGCPMYILSNSIFGTRVLEHYLEKHAARSYFTKVWSSADFGMRKPAHEFFDMAVAHILSENKGASKSDIIFVGNSYRYDVHGGCGAGLETVWLNEAGEENADGLKVREVRSLIELCD